MTFCLHPLPSLLLPLNPRPLLRRRLFPPLFRLRLRLLYPLQLRQKHHPLLKRCPAKSRLPLLLKLPRKRLLTATVVIEQSPAGLLICPAPPPKRLPLRLPLLNPPKLLAQRLPAFLRNSLLL